MKPFNLEEAKAGKPICTRDGRKARIICFDARIDVEKTKRLITMVTEDGGYERVLSHDIRGRNMALPESVYDLMMVEETDSLPNSWEEFCENYPINDKEYYINSYSNIEYYHEGLEWNREEDDNKNLFRTEAQAEAMLAFIQLIRLRDVYRHGWEPDWTNDDLKYCIYNFMNEIDTQSHPHEMYTLSFQSEEIRDKFLENFKDLIEQAKEFI